MDQDSSAEEERHDDDPEKHEPLELSEKLFPGFNGLERRYHIICLLFLLMLNLC